MNYVLDGSSCSIYDLSRNEAAPRLEWRPTSIHRCLRTVTPTQVRVHGQRKACRMLSLSKGTRYVRKQHRKHNEGEKHHVHPKDSREEPGRTTLSDNQEAKPAPPKQKSTNHRPSKTSQGKNRKEDPAIIDQEAKEHNNPQATTLKPMSTQESREERKGGPKGNPGQYRARVRNASCRWGKQRRRCRNSPWFLQPARCQQCVKDTHCEACRY